MEKKKSSFVKKIIIIAVIGIFVGAFSAAAVGSIRLVKSYFNGGFTVNPTPTPAGPGVIPTLPPVMNPVSISDVSSIVAYVMPSVVAVNADVETETYDIFGRKRVETGISSGSGIIVGQSENELLLATNEHVIRNAKTIKVTFFDGVEYEVVLKGSDRNADLAVLSIQVGSLTNSTFSNIRIATLGKSEDIKTGDFAIAIGNSLGYGQSTTVGFISAVKREVSVEDITRELIQTDAAINPGNSGGALLNANGEVIGINSAKYSSTEVEGMGYAIPISDAVPIINELMNRVELSEKESGYLGITGQTVTTTYAERFDMPVGVYVQSVTADSPAEKAGIKAGEVITAVNGRKISTTEDLETILSHTRAGTTITLSVTSFDGGKEERKVDVTLTSKK